MIIEYIVNLLSKFFGPKNVDFDCILTYDLVMAFRGRYTNISLEKLTEYYYHVLAARNNLDVDYVKAKLMEANSILDGYPVTVEGGIELLDVYDIVIPEVYDTANPLSWIPIASCMSNRPVMTYIAEGKFKRLCCISLTNDEHDAVYSLF